MDKPYTLTLRQFYSALRDETCAECGCTKAQFERDYPVWSRADEWTAAIEDAACDGETIPTKVLDDLAEHAPDFFRLLLKYHGVNVSHNCLPAGYLPPAIQRMNEQHERQMISARKAGRNGTS